MRILIVEDNEDSGATLRMVLAALGHKVKVVADGETALKVAPRFNPHIAIMDLGLPGISGFEAAMGLHESKVGENLRVVALSGWGRKTDRTKAKRAGIHHFLLKPLDLAELKKILESHPNFAEM